MPSLPDDRRTPPWVRRATAASCHKNERYLPVVHISLLSMLRLPERYTKICTLDSARLHQQEHSPSPSDIIRPATDHVKTNVIRRCPGPLDSRQHCRRFYLRTFPYDLAPSSVVHLRIINLSPFSGRQRYQNSDANLPLLSVVQCGEQVMVRYHSFGRDNSHFRVGSSMC